MVKFWFDYGLVIAALGMIRHQKRLAEKEASNNKNRHIDDDDTEDTVELEEINKYCDGLAQVIVPIIRTLNRGPVSNSN